MGRRNTLPKFQVLTSSDSATNPSSIVSEVTGVDTVFYQVESAGTVVANAAVHYSGDGETYYPLNFGTTIALATTDQIKIENPGFKYLKLVVTNNGGTGTINAWVSGTSVGA